MTNNRLEEINKRLDELDVQDWGISLKDRWTREDYLIVEKITKEKDALRREKNNILGGQR